MIAEVCNQMPYYTDMDFNPVELEMADGSKKNRVIAARDSKAREIIFGPDANELDDGSWTLQSSVVLPGGENMLDSKKHLVLKGRLRNRPTPARAFSLFFETQRMEESATEKAVLASDCIEPTISVNLKLPFKRKAINNDLTYSEGNNVKIPILYNMAALSKGTVITAPFDAEIWKMAEQAQKRKQAEAKEAVEAIAKKSRSSR
jgi:hypothetical protein